MHRRRAGLELEETVRFLGPTNDVAGAYATGHVVLVTSISEGFPFAVVEAMMNARPVVATGVGGIPEVVSEGTTGVLVPPADPKALARAIVDLLADPERRTVMGEAAWRRVRDRFPAERMVTLTEGAYQRAQHLAVLGFAQPDRQAV